MFIALLVLTVWMCVRRGMFSGRVSSKSTSVLWNWAGVVCGGSSAGMDQI